MEIKPIGIILTPFTNKKDTPIQPKRSKAIGRIKVFKEYTKGLSDIEAFSHILLIYRFHRSRGYELLVKPFLDTELRGLFATRYPRRPNQIGLSVVRLVKRTGSTLYVKGIDVLNGTPLLDIKPFVPYFDEKEKIRIGWLTEKIK